jgi:PAS domain S-box-containing protein
MGEPTVLIVEDEAIVAEDLATKVNRLGYHVIGTVSTGEQALQVAQEESPDLVLLDVQLPGNLDGIQTATQLNNLCDSAVVFVTAHSDTETVKRANLSGHFGYILKPFSEQDLAIQIDIALYKSQANKTLRENEKRLRQANAYLDLAQKAGSVGFFDYHFKEDLSVWTEGLAQLFGISLHQYEGTWEGWVNRIVPGDAESVRRIVTDCIESGRDHVSYEFRAILPDGSLRWLAAQGRLFYGPDGKAVRMTGVNIDVTKHKQAEQELLRAKQRTIAILTSVGEAVFGLGIDGLSTFINEAGARMFGYDVEELMGKNTHKLLHHSHADGSPYPVGDCPIYASMIDGCMHRADNEVFWHKNGTPIYVSYTSTPIREKGRLVGAVVVIRDITERKHDEQRLVKSEEMLLRAQRGANAGVWEIDLRTERLTWSAPYYDLFGIDHSLQPSVAVWLSCIHPEDRARIAADYRRSISDRREQNMEFRIVKPDGTTRWIHRKGQIEVNDHGEAIRINGISFDITERKQAEEAVQAIALFPDQNPQPVLRISDAGILLYANPAATRVFNEWGLRVGEDVPLYLRTLVLSSFHALQNQETEHHIGLRSYLVTTTPIADAGYANLYWFDITERKQAEAAVRESQERLRAIVETALDGIITIDDRGTIESINPAVERIFQYPREHLIGQNVKMLMPEPDHSHHDGYLQRYQETGEKKIIGIGREVIGRRKDGSVFPLELSISESSLPGRHFFTGILRDISQRKQAEEELRLMTVELDQRVAVRTEELLQSQERLRALAAELNLTEQRERQRIATELHDHLQQLLVLGKLKLGQGKRVAAPIPACVDLMKKVDEVLSEALAYTRTLVAELSPPVLRQYGLAAALKWLSEYMKKRDMVVTVMVPGNSDDMKLPEDQAVLLFQSVRELLINSWKHAGSGKASVRFEQHNDELEIVVQDNGVGCDLAAVGMATPIGAGLSSKFGLFSIRERMKALGGSFDIESSPGHGTTATLRLPLKPQSGKQEPSTLDLFDRITAHPETQSEQSISNPTAILLIDGHDKDRQYYAQRLKQGCPDFLIFEAASGQAGLEIHKSHSIDCVILELGLPDMSGFEVLVKLVPTARRPDIPVIVLTEFSNQALLELATKNGAQVTLQKDTMSGDLLERAVLKALATVQRDGKKVEMANTRTPD